MRVKIKPTRKQDKAWEYLQDDTTRFLVFGGGAGGGKTWFGTQWLVPYCYFYPGSRWFVGRKELKSIKKANLPTFQKFCKRHDIPKTDWRFNAQDNYIEFFNESRIDFLKLKHKPSDPDYANLGSLEYTGGWLEEASEIHFKAFDILKTRVGRWKNKDYDLFPAKILITCNPAKNWLYRLIYKPWRDKRLPEEYAFVRSLYGDNPYTKGEYGKQLSGIRDEATKRRLMLGDWEYEQYQDSLIEYDAILDLFSNVIDILNEKYLTVDVARLGRDKTIIAYWRGWDVKKIEVMEKSRVVGPGDTVSNRISEIMNVQKIPRSHVAIDEGGVGGGVVDSLRGVKGFVSNSSPLKDIETGKKGNYRNLKSQCAYRFARKVNNHEITISADISEEQREAIVADLEQIRARDVHSEKPKEIIPKEEVMEMLGRSPDWSDCLIQRIFLKLQKKTRTIEIDEEDKFFYKKMQQKKKRKTSSFTRRMA